MPPLTSFPRDEMENVDITVNALSDTAAEIVDFDCRQPVTGELLQKLKIAFLQYPVLIFRGQVLSAPELAAFGSQFGALEENPTPQGNKAVKAETAALRETANRVTPDQMLYQSPDHKDVLVMTNEIHETWPLMGVVDNAETWHSDASHKACPCKAIIIHATKNPAAGGETEFCDLRLAYEALSKEMREALDGRVAIHHWSKSKNPLYAETLDAAAKAEGDRIAALVPEMAQPLIRTHPETKRRSLYLSPRFTLRIDRIPPDLSRNILNELFGFIESKAFVYRHSWQEKDLVMWDNRCLNHRVLTYRSDDVRRRQRVTSIGDRPFF